MPLEQQTSSLKRADTFAVYKREVATAAVHITAPALCSFIGAMGQIV